MPSLNTLVFRDGTGFDAGFVTKTGRKSAGLRLGS